MVGLRTLRIIRITRLVKIARLAKILRFIMALRTHELSVVIVDSSMPIGRVSLAVMRIRKEECRLVLTLYSIQGTIAQSESTWLSFESRTAVQLVMDIDIWYRYDRWLTLHRPVRWSHDDRGFLSGHIQWYEQSASIAPIFGGKNDLMDPYAWIFFRIWLCPLGKRKGAWKTKCPKNLVMFSEKRSAFENEVASFGKCVPPKFNPTRYGEPGNAEIRVAAHIKII